MAVRRFLGKLHDRDRVRKTQNEWEKYYECSLKTVVDTQEPPCLARVRVLIDKEGE